MPDDASGSNDEELASQIDDLRARMDRLMNGGTSTSNSALVADPPRQTSQTVVARPASVPPPERTRVRDLIGAVDSEMLEGYAGPEEVVDFPDDDDLSANDVSANDVSANDPKQKPVTRPVEDRPSAPPSVTKTRPVALDGSLIAVGKDRDGSHRPRVTSFDDLNSALAEELARDASVPPVEPKRGPGLASRFGSADEPVAVVTKPVREPDVTGDVEEPEEAGIAEVDEPAMPVAVRSRRGALVAIWGFAAVTSGTIAVLHGAGLI